MKRAESCSEVINRLGKDRFKLRWCDVVNTTHVKKTALPKMRQLCVVVEFPGSLASREVDRGAQYGCYDLDKLRPVRLRH